MKCVICNGTEYKYNICRDCYLNLEFNTYTNFELKYCDEVYPVLFYNNFIKNEIIKFKFNDGTYLTKVFGEILIDYMFKNSIRDIDKIAYVPMYVLDKERRGYNQSYLLAKYIAQNTSIPLLKGLKKVKHTKEQVGLTKEERLINLKEAFEFSGDICDKILLIDDVITSGSTIDEVSKTLKEMGIKKVVSLILATAQSL